MSGYQYTYLYDTSSVDGLPAHQRELGLELLAEQAQTGADLAVLLADVDAPAEDKAALTEVWT